ncbi:MAG TPA: hypothetical protein VFZ48_04000 [Candidatus Saccharimonadales bacterium]
MLRAQVSYSLSALFESLNLEGHFFGAGVTLGRRPKIASYQDELAFYQSIATSDFHVVFCEPGVELTLSCLTEILYAMLKSKPIVLIGGALLLPRQASFYSKRIVHTNSQLFYSISIEELATSIASRVSSLPIAVTYPLNKNQRILIRSVVREHLYKLFVHDKLQHRF